MSTNTLSTNKRRNAETPNLMTSTRVALVVLTGWFSEHMAALLFATSAVWWHGHPLNHISQNNPLFSQQHHNYQPSSTPQPGPEGGLTSTTCLSDESQTQPPSHAPTQPPSQGGSQEQGGYMLTPNAPALYGPVYGAHAFEKPPPYPC